MDVSPIVLLEKVTDYGSFSMMPSICNVVVGANVGSVRLFIDNACFPFLDHATHIMTITNYSNIHLCKNMYGVSSSVQFIV